MPDQAVVGRLVRQLVRDLVEVEANLLLQALDDAANALVLSYTQSLDPFS
ncbi:hypothetical protein [Deinococcus sp. DB0503]|nr:hypothetical protein [Deinococcus sp. DB0503]